MQNIARDSENSSDEEFFDAHGQHFGAEVGVSLRNFFPLLTQPLVPSEGFWDSNEVFPKEMTKWNSNDFIDAFASPMEAEGAPGKDPESGLQHPVGSGDSESKSKGSERQPREDAP